MSELRQVPAPFIQTVNEQGEIVEMKPPTYEGPSLSFWLLVHAPEVYREIFGEPHSASAFPVTDWPTFS